MGPEITNCPLVKSIQGECAQPWKIGCSWVNIALEAERKDRKVVVESFIETFLLKLLVLK